MKDRLATAAAVRCVQLIFWGGVNLPAEQRVPLRRFADFSNFDLVPHECESA